MMGSSATGISDLLRTFRNHSKSQSISVPGHPLICIHLNNRQMDGQIGAMEGVTRQRRNQRHLQQHHQANVAADKKVVASTYFSIEAFLVLACLTVSLLVLPLVLPPLPPPPSLLLLLPVCLLILLIVLAFMPTDVRSMASSYL